MSALQKLHLLIGNQLISRVLTFILNVLVVRSVGAGVFGLVSIHYQLLSSVVLMLSREPARKSTLRAGYRCVARPGQERQDKLRSEQVALAQSNNVAWLSVPASALVSFIMWIIYVMYPPQGLEAMGITSQTYSASTAIFAIACVVEAVGEPLYVHAARCGRVEIRVGAESLAVFVKCIATYALIKWVPQGDSASYLISFALAQLLYSLCFTVFLYAKYFRNFIKPPSKAVASEEYVDTLDFYSKRSVFPCFVSSSQGGCFDAELLGMTKSYLAQTVSKLVLAEGEKMVMVWTPRISLNDQGFFALVQNLGSLVVRLLFQPVEEGAASEFAAQARKIDSNLLLIQGAGINGSPKVDMKPLHRPEPKGKSMNEKNVGCESQDKLIEDSNRLASTFAYLIKTITLVALVMLTFSFAYSVVFFDLVFGNKWSNTEAPKALIMYMAYVLALALNGITEAFVDSTVRSSQTRILNILLLLSALIAMALRIFFATGANSMILIAVIEMGLRIARATWYITNYFKALPITPSTVTLRALAPPIETLFLLFATLVSTCVSFMYWITPLCASRGPLKATLFTSLECMFHCSLADVPLLTRAARFAPHLFCGGFMFLVTVWRCFRGLGIGPRAWKGKIA